jgi:uncharacterized HAD superfamily protein
VRIGLDIDGVMYKWDKTACYMLREVLPNSPYKDTLKGDSLYWNWIPDQIAPEHWKWLWNEGVKLGLFRYGHLFPGTIQAVRRLAELGDVVLITHRPKAAVGDTLAWLSLLNLPISGLHLLTNSEPKSLVMPQCDIYLDDKPENITDLHNNTKGLAVLRRQPWNRDYITRASVENWDQFIAEVEHLRGH